MKKRLRRQELVASDRHAVADVGVPSLMKKRLERQAVGCRLTAVGKPRAADEEAIETVIRKLRGLR